MPSYAEVSRLLDQIEQEMRVSGFWQQEPLKPQQYNFQMAFSQWLQFIFIPRVREIIAAQGQFPNTSQVAVQAAREFDAVPKTSRLLTLLSEFDALIESDTHYG